jgi:hypothetical protein
LGAQDKNSKLVELELVPKSSRTDRFENCSNTPLVSLVAKCNKSRKGSTSSSSERRKEKKRNLSSLTAVQSKRVKARRGSSSYSSLGSCHLLQLTVSNRSKILGATWNSYWVPLSWLRWVLKRAPASS